MSTFHRMGLFALQQACYQRGSLSTPPRQSRPVAVGPLVHASGVRQPLIRTEVVRYVQTITTTLRPDTVAGRTKALRVFFDDLAEHHPEVTRLQEIERTRHIEPYLAWARARPWRGKNRQRRTIGVVAFHQDVVDLRCFFEDIAGWGWPSAPPRRLLFYADIPRTPDALPRALTPDVDRALTTAVANLDDALVRTGLLLLRAELDDETRQLRNQIARLHGQLRANGIAATHVTDTVHDTNAQLTTLNSRPSPR